MRWKLIILLIFFSLSGCKNKKAPEQQPIIPVSIEDTGSQFQNKVYVKYKIPLPLDLFDYLGDNKQFNGDILLPLDVARNFLNDKTKALALGVYNADLAYCSVMSNPQLSIEYFKVSKNLAQDLEVEAGYSDDLFNRLNNNIDNIDSIRKITDEAYWQACNYLDENDKYNILPFVVYGGWIESIYLILKSETPGNRAEVRDLVLKQRQGFNNVKNFIYDAQLETSAYFYHDDLKKIIQQIQGIINLYDRYQIATNTEKEKIYNQIASKIISYRTQIINGKL